MNKKILNLMNLTKHAISVDGFETIEPSGVLATNAHDYELPPLGDYEGYIVERITALIILTKTLRNDVWCVSEGSMVIGGLEKDFPRFIETPFLVNLSSSVNYPHTTLPSLEQLRFHHQIGDTVYVRRRVKTEEDNGTEFYTVVETPDNVRNVFSSEPCYLLKDDDDRFLTIYACELDKGEIGYPLTFI